MPTAILCSDDEGAIRLMDYLKNQKIRVPEQISVIGIGNIERSGYISPMLTTVGMPIAEMGSIAVQTLISRIERRHRKSLCIYLENELIIRQSTLHLSK